MLNQSELPIYFLDVRFFDNDKFWREINKLDKRNHTNRAQSLKDAIARVYRMADPAIELYHAGSLSVFFPTEVAVFCLQYIEFEDIKNILQSCRTTADSETDRVIELHSPKNLTFNTTYQNSFAEVQYALEYNTASCPIRAITIIGEDLPLRIDPPAQPRASRISPSFILACVLAGGTVIAVAMLLGASFGTACLTVAAVGAVATLTLGCVGFFSPSPANASSNREELEPDAPSRWSSCCTG